MKRGRTRNRALFTRTESDRLSNRHKFAGFAPASRLPHGASAATVGDIRFPTSRRPRMKPPEPSAPTTVRYGVLAFACTLSMITYLDRAAFGSAAEDVIAALGLNGIGELGPAMWAFLLAYAAFEVPTGWLGDVFGPRTTLIRIVLWWSFFTGLTGLVGLPIAGIVFVNFWVLVLIRFLFGMGEAGAYPNITRALHNWFPLTERGIAQGWVWMSGRLMGGLTPLLWGLLVAGLGLSWRTVFWLFAALGVSWCLLFAAWFRNRPREKAGVNEAELELIETGTRSSTESAHANVPWGRLLMSGNLWAVCLMYAAMTYGWYFAINYLPSFMQLQFGVQKSDWLGSLAKGGPLILGAVGCLIGGWLTDTYIKRTGDRLWGRRIFGMFGHAACVPLLLYCRVADNAWTFALAIGLSGFFNDLAMGSAWAVCQDIGRRHAAIVAGCMNTIGNLGGFVATLLSARFIDMSLRAHALKENIDLDALSAAAKTSDIARLQLLDVRRIGELPGYQLNFLIYAAMYGIAALLWLRINATKPVVPDDADGD